MLMRQIVDALLPDAKIAIPEIACRTLVENVYCMIYAEETHPAPLKLEEEPSKICLNRVVPPTSAFPWNFRVGLFAVLLSSFLPLLADSSCSPLSAEAGIWFPLSYTWTHPMPLCGPAKYI